MECLKESHLNELANSTLDSFDENIVKIPEDQCYAFQQEAKSLEAQLLVIYKMVVLCVRDEEDLANISKCWKLMVGLCDRFMQKVASLSEQHPYCGADVYHDRILDLRNQCQRLQKLHS
jgi:hypothetical protein